MGVFTLVFSRALHIGKQQLYTSTIHCTNDKQKELASKAVDVIL